MATEQHTKPLMESIDKCLTYKSKDLVKRTDWGSITFDKASHDLNRIYSIVDHLKILPIDQLTDQVATDIKTTLDQVIGNLEELDKFTIERENPTQVRDSHASSLHKNAERLHTFSAPWIPFLAYQKGDVANNIAALTKSVSDAKIMTDQAALDIEGKKNEINKIIIAAREASAGAGAAVFTHDFDRESKTQDEAAGNWLIATVASAVTTMVAAGGMWYWAEPNLDYGQLTQKFGTKLAILAVLFTSTLWCSRIYRALKHQSSTNRHRALSLQTFQAFSAAAADVGTKDAVLLETTRAIFTFGATGYLEDKPSSTGSDVRIVEVKSPTMSRAIEDASKTAGTAI